MDELNNILNQQKSVANERFLRLNLRIIFVLNAYITEFWSIHRNFILC